MLRAGRNIARLVAIVWTLARHDALYPLEVAGFEVIAKVLRHLAARGPVEGRVGQRLAAALHALGPSFIKLGQALSTRPDVVGEAIADDLANLQDRLPPSPGTEARLIVEDELGAPIEHLFADFEDHAVAAASIAQVHHATTSDGRRVAVKVRHPGVEDAFAQDVELFYWLAGLVEHIEPGLRRLRPVEVVGIFADSVALEMDLRFEAAAASELRENLAGDDGFYIPEIDWQRTSQRVMTIERIEGIPIDERDAIIEAGHDVDAVLEKASRAFFNQVFRDGFFHADLHPGNLFVNSDGDIAAVDFGIMGRLDRETRRYLAEMLLGFLTGDYGRVARIHFEAGYVPAEKSTAAFTQACRSIGEPIMGKPLNEISLGQLLAQLFQVTETFAMETQPQLLLLQKTMLLAEAIGRRLNPEVNLWSLAQPLIEDWVVDNLGPEARLRETVDDGRAIIQRLPRLLADAEATLAAISRSGVKLHPDTVAALAEAGAKQGGQTLVWAAIAALLLAVVALA
ncbi:MAG: 2-polyprenylphenol 6-hydroxylase [Pseudomonadota bacterium]|nr:2-polyprenylphenol 6-hydroxylase [Pseudomonadota bacterium]